MNFKYKDGDIEVEWSIENNTLDIRMFNELAGYTTYTYDFPDGWTIDQKLDEAHRIANIMKKEAGFTPDIPIPPQFIDKRSVNEKV